MNEIIKYIFESILLGVISWVWIKIILDIDNLGFIYDFFNRFMSKTIITRIVFKPLFECFYCFAGQSSLWWYLMHNISLDYNIVYHIGFICISILTTKIINVKYG